MQMVVRFALLGAFALSPAVASAQGLYTLDPNPDEETLVIEEPVVVEERVVVREPAVIVEEPLYGGPIVEEDAVAIAMANGVVAVEDVHKRWFDGNFEVDGTMADGEDVEVTIDANSGAVIEIDN